jgi:hypothetical protein
MGAGNDIETQLEEIREEIRQSHREMKTCTIVTSFAVLFFVTFGISIYFSSTGNTASSIGP